MQQHSKCTLGLALALAAGAIPFTVVSAASHCKGLAQVECRPESACRWMPEAKAGEPTKSGTPRKRDQRAHCRLDVKAAAEIAKRIHDERKK